MVLPQPEAPTTQRELAAPLGQRNVLEDGERRRAANGIGKTGDRDDRRARRYRHSLRDRDRHGRRYFQIIASTSRLRPIIF